MGKKRNKADLPQLPNGVNIVDTHCHLDMIDSGNDVDARVQTAAAAGVAPIITVGIDLPSSKNAVLLAARYQHIYATVGIHPHNVQGLTDSAYSELEELCKKPEVVAYGEIGLDYVKQYAPRDTQRAHYERQVDLARKMQIPLVIHDREAHEDILHVLRNRAPFAAGGIMHCFSGDWNFARKVLDLGFFISIPGVVTFKKAAAMQEVATKAPLDKLLLETDAPFLAPEPLRGKKNVPEYILYAAQKIAELRGMSLAELARVTTENARHIFRIPPYER